MIVIEAVALAAIQAAEAGVVGRWEGALRIGPNTLPLVVRVETGPAGMTAALDSPTQGARGIPITDLTVTTGTVRFAVPSLGGRYEGAISTGGELWTGAWSQGGSSLPLVLARSAAETGAAVPDQLPVPEPASPAGGLTGIWEGQISVGGQRIRIVFRIDADGNAVMDSPDQGARNIAVDRPMEAGDVVRFVIPVLQGQFEGKRSEDGGTLTGVLDQGGMSVPLVLTRTAATAVLVRRPQTPAPPFPYRSETVAFDNPSAPGVRLAGTLTLPEGPGPFPAAVLITGTGPQDRDETIEGHKPFAIWADALTRRGIAVLRHDDRGVAASTGDFGAATGRDFATDVRAARDWLAARPEIDPARVGLIGHSEGASFAWMALEDGLQPAWLVTLAGPAVSGGDIITEQGRRIAQAAGAPAASVESGVAVQRQLMAAVAANAGDAANVRREVEAVMLANGAMPEAATRTAAVMSSAWYRGLVAYDPGEAIQSMSAPLLAVYGGKDLQVPADQNAPVVSRLKPDADVVVLPGLNHLFQPTATGLIAEYGEIEITLDPAVIRTVIDWVAARSGL
ncbi:alpha/beta hydrolase family protein [Brevundimonas sp. R86498]|uniref:alpha/beta hydrolase family protein n=1 Tax=Brevundimonas sp. R86498 TaxID=3093845 RepID=UPI0037CADA72